MHLSYATRESRTPRRHLPQLVAIVSALGLALAGVPALATHQSGTLSPSNPSVSWSNPLAQGVNNPTGGEAECIEDTPTPGAGTCETYVLTLAPANYGFENEIVVKISWSTSSDWDLYIHEDTPTGTIVAQNVEFDPLDDPPGDTQTEASFFIEPIATAKTYYVHVVAASSAPGYSGQAMFRFAPTPTLTATWGKIKTSYR